jgi:hypothetical protein
MAYTLLQLVDRVAAQIGLTQPSAVIGSSDPQVNQLQYLAEQLGQDLLKEYEWQRLLKPYYFTTTPAMSLYQRNSISQRVQLRCGDHYRHGGFWRWGAVLR